MTFVTGERIQMLAQVFLGEQEDFNFNPVIAAQTNKQQTLRTLPPVYHNPAIVFCYTHRLGELVKRLDAFLQPFTLITHNSDGCVMAHDPLVQRLLQSPKLKQWFAQNVGFAHPKLHIIPIGLANGQWGHGVGCWQQTWPLAPVQQAIERKPGNIYCCFNVSTNAGLRQPCLEAMQRLNIPVLPLVSPSENIGRMAAYRFVICPEGNGFDTHRLWECWYLKCVPIVLNTTFIQTFQAYYGQLSLPLVVIEAWTDLRQDMLPSYAEISLRFANMRNLLTMEHYTRMIHQSKG
jgi:hypothetical protein